MVKSIRCPKCGQNELMNVTITTASVEEDYYKFKKIECAKCGELIRHDDISDTGSLVFDNRNWVHKYITLEYGDDVVLEMTYTPDDTAYVAIKPKQEVEHKQVTPEWISLNQQYILPQFNTPVLIYNPKYKEISVACLRRSETTRKLYWQSIDYPPCCCDFDEVSHWMSLPEPPKE